MAYALLITSVIIFSCVLFNKVSSKLGVPMLLAFIVFGMCFGSDGFAKIHFDNYYFAEQICSASLIFIMFYGGFGTKWSQAKPVAVKSILLSSLGTVITAMLVGVFCHYVLNIGFLESFLIGSVISSTDAASVFSILRSKRLNLKYNTASLLEVESGSNDPFSYMLTVIVLSLMNGEVSAGKITLMLFGQIFLGVIFGFIIAKISLVFLNKYKFTAAGFDSIFMVGVALISYALPVCLGGNGYLSAYITGIILGNSRISHKQTLVNFFDGITALMQMLLFFLLGLLAFPSQLPRVAGTAILIALFMTFVARPLAVFAILTPFKSKLNQMFMVSWAGMRGAASIVFAIIAFVNPAVTDNDIFHIVFFIVLFSILVQGSLIPAVSKVFAMTDNESDVMKTFTDYSDEVPVQFLQFTVNEEHQWAGKKIKEIVLPPDSIFVLLIRREEKIVPNGNTLLEIGDTLVLSGKATSRIDGVNLYEKDVVKGDEWIDKKISEIPSGEKLIIMIRRNENVLIPKGKTVIREKDVLVINEPGIIE